MKVRELLRLLRHPVWLVLVFELGPVFGAAAAIIREPFGGENYWPSRRPSSAQPAVASLRRSAARGGAAVLANGGASWNTVEKSVSGKGERERVIRDRLISSGRFL